MVCADDRSDRHLAGTDIGSQGPPEIIILPPRGWLRVRIRELWEFRDLYLMLSWRHIQVRYKQTLLGAVWALLQPVSAAAAFAIVFRNMVGDTQGVPYLLFAYAGVLLWQLVASVVNTGSMSLVDNAPLITKVFFPRLLVVLSVFGFTLLDFALGAVILACLLLWFGVGVGVAVLLFPLAVVGTLLCAASVAILLAALATKYRDFRFVVPFLVQMWFFLSPIIYPTTKLAPRVEQLMALNPMTGWLGLFRFSLLGTPLDLRSTVFAAAASVVLAAAAVTFFRQVEDSFADII